MTETSVDLLLEIYDYSLPKIEYFHDFWLLVRVTLLVDWFYLQVVGTPNHYML